MNEYFVVGNTEGPYAGWEFRDLYRGYPGEEVEDAIIAYFNKTELQDFVKLSGWLNALVYHGPDFWLYMDDNENPEEFAEFDRDECKLAEKVREMLDEMGSVFFVNEDNGAIFIGDIPESEFGEWSEETDEWIDYGATVKGYRMESLAGTYAQEML